MTGLAGQSAGSRLAEVLASWFGAGFSPVAPGTVGSLAALPFVALVLMLDIQWVLVCSLLLMLVGVWSAGIAGRHWGQVDHGSIVIDEVLGQLLAIAIPHYLLGGQIAPVWLYSLGFLGFRLFDIVKPWPADVFDRRAKNGWGVMLDDVVAGIWAGPVVTLLLMWVLL